MIQVSEIQQKVIAYAPDADISVIQSAFEVSAKCHAGQIRKSGEPYVVHPLAVADILADLRLDIDSIAVGLLHDVIEDTLITYDDLRGLFNIDIADMVDGLSKIAKIQFKSREEAQAENFRKMLFAMARDIRVILVKLADRTHNMRTLSYMKPERQEAIARETLDIYAPIANRLGIQRLKVELEDLAFFYLHRDAYQKIQSQLNELEGRQNEYLDRVRSVLLTAMEEHEIGADVSGRQKHVYSIYRKMVRNSVELEQIYDLTAFRILVDNIGQCYQALGVVHAMYSPISERFKDYIAVPKSNGYRSLHTTVIGPGGERIEIQIRTRDLHHIAESGIAAHWRYKEGHLALNQDDIEKVVKLRQLYDLANELKDPTEFMQSVRQDLFADEIYVFTPKGEVKEFPEGATPLDFAFAVHTEIGLHCSGAKVNGRIVPFSYALQNGDTVEIFTSSGARPSTDWLGLVVSSKARNKIRNYLRQEERERGRELGREILDREFRRRGLTFNKLLREDGLKLSLERFHFRNIDELYIAVAVGKIALEKVLADYAPPEEKSLPTKVLPPSPSQLVERIRDKILPKRPSSPVLIRGEGDIMVSFARCCSPLHGDPIVGIITVGHGITVHTAGCFNAINMDPVRRIEVEWDESVKKARSVRVRVVTVNRPGLLASMSNTISHNSVNITSAEIKSIEDEKAVSMFELTILDRATLQKVISALERIRGVISVERMTS